jgi:hypothetical protein
MSYKQGDLKYCSSTDDPNSGLYDARGGWDGKYPTVYLEHSCWEWVIGGEKEIEELIHDLNIAWCKIKGLKGCTFESEK